MIGFLRQRQTMTRGNTGRGRNQQQQKQQGWSNIVAWFIGNTIWRRRQRWWQRRRRETLTCNQHEKLLAGCQKIFFSWLNKCNQRWLDFVAFSCKRSLSQFLNYSAKTTVSAMEISWSLQICVGTIKVSSKLGLGGWIKWSWVWNVDLLLKKNLYKKRLETMGLTPSANKRM